MALLVSKRGAMIGSVLALPFAVIGIYYSVYAYTSSDPESAMYYWIYANLTFVFFGAPLTAAYAYVMPSIGRLLVSVIGRDLHELVIPVYVLLLWIQWILWSQIVLFLYRKTKKLRAC